MASVSRSSVLAAQRNLAGGLTVCATTLLVIGVWPKAGPGHERFRFACTVAFFAACLGFLWLLTEPRSRYMRLLYAWRYEGRPALFERHWKRYLLLLDRVVAWPARAGIVLCAALMCRAILSWYVPAYPVLGRLGRPVAAVGWGAMAMLVVFPFVGASWIRELAQRRRILEEEASLSGDRPPRALHGRPDAAERTARLPVIHDGPGRFHAGGVAWRFEELTQNVLVLGQPGSGKTVCILNALLDGLIGSNSSGPEPIGGLLLDPKGDFGLKLDLLARRHGREADLHVIDPNNPAAPRWNPLDSDASPVELGARLVAVMETLGMRSGDSSFFHDYTRKFIRHAIALVRASNGRGVPPSLADLGRLARDESEVRRRLDSVDRDDPALTETFGFFREWARLNSDTADGVIGSVTNLVDPFLAPPYDSAFGSRSTLRTGDMIDRGKLVYLELPASGDTEAIARLAGTLLKVDYLREVAASRRLRKPRPTFFFCDEFQKFFTVGGVDGGLGRGDADYCDVVREANHTCIVAAQNLHSLYRCTSRPEVVKNFLGLFATKIFLRNTDPDTNEYAASVFGQSLGGGANYGAQHGGRGRGLLESLNVSGVADQAAHRVAPDRFARLAIPSPTRAQAGFCESYVFQGAAPDVSDLAPIRRWTVHPIRERRKGRRAARRGEILR